MSKLENITVSSFIIIALLSGVSSKITYRVVLQEDLPFVTYNDKTKNWTGYSIDLFNAIVKMSPFDYTTYSLESTIGKAVDNYTNVLNEIVERRADIALGGIAVTAEREEVVDFTEPIHTKLLGISIIAKRVTVDTEPFLCFKVLELGVWLMIAGAFFCTALSLWICELYSPFSYRNHKCKNEMEVKASGTKRMNLQLREYAWLTLLCTTPQGVKKFPRNWSGKVIFIFWSLFTIILLALYCANVAAVLTVSKMGKSVETLDEWINREKYTYAPLENSRTYWYFHNMAEVEKEMHRKWKEMNLQQKYLFRISKEKTIDIWDYPLTYKYTKMLDTMKRTGFPKTVDEALNRIKASNNTNRFAFISETFTLEIMASQNCDLFLLKDEFSLRNIGFVLQKHLPIKNLINQALYTLKNNKVMDEINQKWANKKHCEEYEANQEGKIVKQQMIGLFVFVLIGIIAGSLCIFVEYEIVKYTSNNSTVSR